MSWTTIDLDDISEEEAADVVGRIAACLDLRDLVWKRSPSGKGFHVTLWCSRCCEECRKKYDDPRRYHADKAGRKPHQQNVLFDRKEIYERGKLVSLRESREMMGRIKAGGRFKRFKKGAGE